MKLGLLTLSARPAVSEPASSPPAAVRVLLPLLGSLAQEAVAVLPLNERLRPLPPVLVALGRLNCLHFEPADVLRPVLLAGVRQYIVVHNHPSGDPQPSDADFAATKKLRLASDLLGLELLDHIIIAGGSWLSLRETGALQ